MPMLVHQINEASLAEPRKSKHVLLAYIDDINSNKVEVYLSEAKNNEILKLLQNARKKSYIKIRKLSKLIGKLTAPFPRWLYGLLL